MPLCVSQITPGSLCVVLDKNQITFKLLKGDLLCESCFFFFSSGSLLPKIKRVHWAGLQCKWTINLLNSTIQTA